jgi:cyclopropane fatty-acyl-phospholipid synthase-like methyltransferase
MINASDRQASGDAPEESASSLFQKQWLTYRKMVDNNYTFHREVYGELHRILIDGAVQPFRFLDIACGDASMAVTALRGTQIAHYHGIDLSQAALDLARSALAELACPVVLERRDYVAALSDCPEPVDVVWIGYSLHHLLGPAKLGLMRAIRAVVADRGLFLMCEPASPDGEDRGAWLRRYELLNQPLWNALTPQEWDAVMTHVRSADFPETSSQWNALGQEAGSAKCERCSWRRTTSIECIVSEPEACGRIAPAQEVQFARVQEN